MSEEREGQAWRVLLFTAPLAAFVALAWIVETGDGANLDARIRNFSHDLSSPALTFAMLSVTRLGSVAVVGAISVAACAGFYWAGRRRSAWMLAAAMVGSAALENGLKYAFQRARPDPFFGLAAPESYSFPSGHALFSACLYGAIAWRLGVGAKVLSRRAAIWATALALIFAIGLSRIYLGVHYPSDVLGGWLVATFWLAALGAWSTAPSSRGIE